MCGRSDALTVEDEFKVGEADGVDNTADIEQAVDDVVSVINKEEKQKAKDKGNGPGSEPEEDITESWTAYQLQEYSDFESTFMPPLN